MGHPCLVPDFERRTFNISSLHVAFGISNTELPYVLEYTFLMLDWEELNSSLALEQKAKSYALGLDSLG